jgi:integrase
MQFTYEGNAAIVPGAVRRERSAVPKRRFQRGCIRKVGESWILYFYRDEERDGVIRRVQVSQRLGSVRDLSSRAASAAAQPIIDTVNNQIVIPVKSKGITLAEFIPEWRGTALPTLKPSTAKGMESSLRAHILPVLGAVPLTGLDAKQVQRLVNSLTGCSRKTRGNIVMDLFAITAAARGKLWQYLVPVVELSEFYIPGTGPGEPSSFSPEEMQAIIRAFAGRQPWDLFFMMLALTGLRASEILGLRVKDCDLKRSLIFVRQTAWEGKIILGTKTENSKNSVQMPSEIKKKLAAYLLTHQHDLLFVNRRGRPYSRNKIVEKVLHPILDVLGIERKGRRIGLHAFRHGLASMLIDSAGAAVAQRQLRHSDAATTLGIYGHVIGNGHIEAMEAIQSILINTPEVSAVQLPNK